MTEEDGGDKMFKKLGELMKYTSEQLQVIEERAPLVAVNAFAGAGKTSTLIGFAQARQRQRILYLAFNRAIAEEAASKMPSNVTAKTAHSLAWGAAASALRHKISNKIPPAQALACLSKKHKLKDDLQSLKLCAQAIDLLGDFLYSQSHDIEAHFARSEYGEIEPLAKNLAKDIWLESSRPDGALPATHDTYFKLWQLSRPVLPFDAILLDEAQDTNPALFDIFMSQGAQKVLVGDRHQNIYGFRRSMNAMAAAASVAKNLRLTKSFRFGGNIAKFANKILHTYTDEDAKIEGCAPHEDVVSETFLSPEKYQTAILTRTNAGLFEIGAVFASKGGRHKLRLLGEFSDYAFDDTLDIYYLMRGARSEIRSKRIAAFGSFSSMKAQAEATNDDEIKCRIRVVEQYGGAIPDIYRKLKQMVEDGNSSPKGALVMTTMHRSKGCEWDQVIIGLDAKHLPRLKMIRSPDLGDEVNLMYVAATRAKKSLVVREREFF